MARSARSDHSAQASPSRRAAVVALVAVIVAVLSACTSARNASVPASTARKGGSVTVATALDAQPSGVFVTLARNNSWIQNVFQPIIELDPKTSEPKPVLATKWQFGPDNKSIEVFSPGASLEVE
jgi:peptide/nickel transport system substrate-binding protein